MKKLALLLVTFILTACGEDFFYGQSNRPEPKKLPSTVFQNNVKILWSTNVGKSKKNFFRPAIFGNNVYTASSDGEINAVNIDNGEKHILVNLKNHLSAGVTAADGRLFVVTKNGDLIALNAENGETLWRERLSSFALTPPVFSAGLIIVRSVDGSITAFEANTGERLWQHLMDVPVISLHGNSAPLVGGGIVIVGDDNGHFTFLDITTGLVINEQPATPLLTRKASGLKLFDIDGDIKVNQNVIFLSVNELATIAIDLSNGQTRWEQHQAATNSDFALSLDGLFLATQNDHLIALNQHDGSIRWETDILEGRKVSPVFAIAGAVGVVDYEGYLQMFSDINGDLIGQKRLGSSNANTMPLVLDDRIIWQLTDGTLTAFTP